MKFDSIRWRLVLSYVLLTLLTVGLVGMLALTLLQQFIHAQTKAQLQSNARTIATQAAVLMNPAPRLDDLQDLANSLAFLGGMRVRILDEQNNILVDSGLPDKASSVVWMQPDPTNQGQPSYLVPLSPRHLRDNLGQAWMRDALGRRTAVIVRIEQGPWGRQMVLVEPNNSPETLPAPTSTPVLRPGQSALVPGAAYESVRYPIGASNNPSGYVQLDAPAASGEQILAAMRRALLLAGLGATLVAAIAGLLVGRSLTAPVLALSESATRMSSGDLSARAPERGAGEIGLLARQFNHMASSLQASFQAISTERDTLRRFIADASHELRTPITALGNFVELLQGPAADDQAAREEFLSESQKQVRRMEWIAGNLLDLSRMDAGLIQLDLHPHDLGDLLEAAAGPFLPRAQEKGIRLVIDPPSPPVNISCDRARMEMALGNLLDNALKFTPAGGLVRLSGSSSEQGIRITVEDDGAGIETDDLPFIFERFYRGQATTDGSGLGLSIVKSIIQAHGGQVSIESQPGQGTRATIDFPLS